MSAKAKPLPETKKIGRPRKYTEELAQAICVQIASGSSLVTICKKSGMPSYATVLRWRHDEPAFCEMYARAREDQADTHVEEMLEVARTKSENPLDTTDVQHRRLLIDTLKWRASKMKPKTYGDKIVAEHGLSDPLAALLAKAYGTTITPVAAPASDDGDV